MSRRRSASDISMPFIFRLPLPPVAVGAVFPIVIVYTATFESVVPSLAWNENESLPTKFGLGV